MYQKTGIINGNFGTKRITVLHLKGEKKNKNIFIFLHGACSTTLKAKYIYLAKKMVDKNYGDCILFESSRFISFQQSITKKMTFEQYANSFQGKTFTLEMNDMWSVVEWVQNKYKNCDIAFHLIGMSLGGIIAGFFISKLKSKLQSITLIGSGSRIVNKRTTLTKTAPSSKHIIANFKKFKGVLSVINGSADDTIPLNSAEAIFVSAQSVLAKKMTVLEGVDHRFTEITGKNKEKKLTEIILNQIEQTIITSTILRSRNNTA